MYVHIYVSVCALVSVYVREEGELTELRHLGEGYTEALCTILVTRLKVSNQFTEKF